MTDRKEMLTRRRLLQGLGAAAGAVTFAGPLVSQIARAETPGAKRLIIFCSPNEPIRRSYWLPHGGQGNEFQITGMRQAFAPLDPHQDKLVFVGDLDLKSRLDDPKDGGHVGIAHLLVGRRVISNGPTEQDQWAGGISVDQHIAKARKVSALTLGARVTQNNGNSRISYRGAEQPVDPINSPEDAFTKLFADADLSADELAARRAQRLSVLDRVRGDLARLRTRVPGEAREKLELHTDMIRELELQLGSDAAAACTAQAPQGNNWTSNAMFPRTIRRQIDVAVQALGCGLTDVATLQLSNSGGGNLTPLWPEENANFNDSYHDLAHNFNRNSNNNGVTSRRVEVERFFSRMFAYLLQRLDETPEATGGSMLDSSLVLWMKPLGYDHTTRTMLFILAGSAAGQLETGRFVSFEGRPHNDLLVSLCNLMGLPDQQFGDPKYCTGALPL